LCTRRVAETQVWASEGDRSAAHWLARTTGSTVGAAVATVETARRLEELSATEDALRSGRLSAPQVEELASAAAADPTAEMQLLETAEREGIQGLREQCRRVKAAATTDELDRYEQIRRSRYLRHWSDRDGAFRLDARLTPDAGATVLAALEPHREAIFREARAAGRREGFGAYEADALVALAEAKAPKASGKSGHRAAVQVRVDHAAFVRGHVQEGEVCEIPGIGPIPVATARALADDAVLSAVVTHGTDVQSIARIDRTIPAKLRTALEARDPICVVEGCDARHDLEIDHVVPFAEGGPTSLPNLARLCRWHHYLKTHRGYRLLGPPGSRRRLAAPDTS
jgi:hypothetical protein